MLSYGMFSKPLVTKLQYYRTSCLLGKWQVMVHSTCLQMNVTYANCLISLISSLP